MAKGAVLNRRPTKERLLAECGNRHVSYDFFRGIGKHAAGSEFLVVMLHGWLGSETLNYAAEEIAWHGHDVAVPIHDHSFHVRTMLRPNHRRSQDAHVVTKHASVKTGKNQVVIIDHSNGNQDALHMVQHASTHNARYHVHAVGAVAGVGMNGRVVSPLAVISESLEHAQLLVRHPRQELNVLGRSALNYLRNPFLAAQEGIVAATTNCREGYSELLKSSVVDTVLEVYLDQDHLIPPPEGRGIILPGSHMTPVVEPEVMTYVVTKLAS